MHGAVVLPRVPGLAIARCLGRGGMGAVFLAQTRGGREVALKVIAGDGPPAADALVRFHREIDALAELQHPHIVRLLGAGAIDGRPYAILERIVGRPLARVRPRTAATAVDLAWQLARALTAVHAAGWVHRDIKLGNALVSEHGFLTLIDFGLAKRIGDDDHGASVVAVAGDPADVTVSGTVVGTPRYLAPEVRAGEVATPASDVYGLGLVLRDLLRRASDPTRPGLARLVDAMTGAAPYQRPTAADLVQDLEPWLGELLFVDDATVHDGVTWPDVADGGPTVPLR